MIILKLGGFKKNNGTLKMIITDNATDGKIRSEIKDEPDCGFDGKKCQELKSNLYIILYIALGG